MTGMEEKGNSRQTDFHPTGPRRKAKEHRNTVWGITMVCIEARTLSQLTGCPSKP